MMRVKVWHKVWHPWKLEVVEQSLTFNANDISTFLALGKISFTNEPASTATASLSSAAHSPSISFDIPLKTPKAGRKKDYNATEPSQKKVKQESKSKQHSIEVAKNKLKADQEQLAAYAANIRQLEQATVKERERIKEEKARLDELFKQKEREQNDEMDKLYKHRLQSLELLDVTTKQKEDDVKEQWEKVQNAYAAIQKQEDNIRARETSISVTEAQLLEQKKIVDGDAARLKEKQQEIETEANTLQHQKELAAKRAIEQAAAFHARGLLLDARAAEVGAFQTAEVTTKKKRKAVLIPNPIVTSTVLHRDNDTKMAGLTPKSPDNECFLILFKQLAAVNWTAVKAVTLRLRKRCPIHYHQSCRTPYVICLTISLIM